jgi:hypothetical protein
MLNWLKGKIPRWRGLLILTLVAVIEFFILHYSPRGSLLSTETKLGVDEVVTQLKGELERMETERETSGAHPLFVLHDFDVELAFVVSRDASQKGKIEYQVVSAEMERKIATEQTHKIVLHMRLAPPSRLQSSTPTSNLSPEGAIRLR